MLCKNHSPDKQDDRFEVYRDNIVVGTFHDEIETELKTKYPDLMRGAPTGTAAEFILTQALRNFT